MLQAGPEVGRVTRQANRSRRHRKRGAERKLPDKEKRNDPPDLGMAAPSSAHTRPSHMAKIAPRIQPSMACGPPIAPTINGMVMNGPTPIMSIMFRAVALLTPMPLIKGWDA